MTTSTERGTVMPKNEYPDLYDFTNENIVVHPIVEELKTNSISKVEVVTDFTDDHETCLCVKVHTTNDKEYKFTAMWLSLVGVRMFFHAECEGEKGEEARRSVETYVKEIANDA